MKKKINKHKSSLMIILLHISKIGMCEAFIRGFPDGSASKESACNAGDTGDGVPLVRSPGGGNGNPFQYSCLEDPMEDPWKIPEEPGGLYSPKCHRQSDKTEHESTSFYQGD